MSATSSRRRGRKLRRRAGLPDNRVHSNVSVQRVPAGSREVLRQKRVDIFVGPTGSDVLECLGEPRVGVDVVEARGRCNEEIVAHVSLPASEPANRAFFRVMVIGRIARSTMLLSSSTRPSSRNRRNSVLREREYRMASASLDLPEIRVSSLSHRAMSSSTIGVDVRRRASRRVCGSQPLTCASTAHRSATRSTVQVAVCDTPSTWSL